jgi:hypothetical protein
MWQFSIKFVVIVLVFLTTSQLASAQQLVVNGNPRYKTAIGAKYAPFAVTLKVFSGKKNRAFELLADFDDGFRLTGLYELYGNLNDPGNLKWYVGFGAHSGYYDKGGKDGTMFGVDGVAGLDYKFMHLPLNISLDWQPAMEFITPDTEFQAGRGGLAVRLAF